MTKRNPLANRIVALAAILSLTAVSAASAATPRPTAQGVEFFEKKIRPVLAQHCYDCHNSIDKAKGGLALDYRDALLKGGDAGAVIVPGDPNESPLIWAIRHEEHIEMPANAPKLSDAIIRDFERWVKMGAPDPRDTRPTKENLEKKLPWPQVRGERAKWWSFQPLRRHESPAADDPAWNGGVIDRFVYQRMRSQGLTPQPEANAATLARRLHLILTGLPPTPADVEAFVKNPTPAAYEAMVERLLASDTFGEKWARHWMDWYRYAESHGSEGDPPIPYAEQYRAYLIRALNADVPYNQLLREHIAGDLLKTPRINTKLGINESALGPAHFRMVPHGFGVTDAYGEQITFTDNQIDVVSKAMLGVTVSCARCHDHKFDPISQKDFYKLYGVMISNRPSTVVVDTRQRQDTNKQAIADLKPEIRRAFAEFWLTELVAVRDRIAAKVTKRDKGMSNVDPLAAWLSLKDLKGDAFTRKLGGLVNELNSIREANAKAKANAVFYLDLRDQKTLDNWYAGGNAFDSAPKVSPAGAFALAGGGDRAVTGIYPAGVYSHLISDRHAAVLSSGNFVAEGKQTMMRVAGSNAEMRTPIRNYPLTHGGLHPADKLKEPTLTWRRTGRKWQYWSGEKVHYELRTARDIIPRVNNAERSWWGVAEVIAGDQTMRDEGASVLDLVDDPARIAGRDALLDVYVDALRGAIEGWRDGEVSDKQAQLLDAFVRRGLLTNRLKAMPADARKLVERYRALEAEIPTPTRAPGLLEAEPVDQPLLVRGEYKHEADPVKRGFLEIYTDTPFARGDTGRVELAESIVSETNTLKSRLLVNRLWAYVFGRGIVSSTDNLGRLGEKPTHPQLLDRLALDFERTGWSIKRTLKRMVMSRTFRSTSQAPAEVREHDPNNAYLSHFTPRRLDAEAILDSVRRLGNDETRAVYRRVIRNRLDPFLKTFNAPIPTTTTSRRNHVDVPAQALTMLNGAIVRRAAERWSARIARDGSLPTPRDKMGAMVAEAYGRSATERELAALLAYFNGEDVGDDPGDDLAQKLDDARMRLAKARLDRERVIAPVRKRLQAEVDRRNAEAAAASKVVDLKPVARWDFEGDLRDALGKMHGTIKGNARIDGGVLVLDGGCVLTEPLDRPLGAKTLEVLVELATLEQRGGGAMTVQTPSGNEFDSIVYAEAGPRQWLAGSDHFRRTVPLDGPKEAEADKRPVRITLTYDVDGTIRSFRDGKPYADPYRKAALRRYKSGEAQVAFGWRHGTGPTGNRMLRGRIHEARLYDRALTAEEVAASVSGTLKEVVTERMLLSALSPEKKQQLESHDATIRGLQKAASQLERELRRVRDSQQQRGNAYYGIAHALLNSKEFIYVY